MIINVTVRSSALCIVLAASLIFFANTPLFAANNPSQAATPSQNATTTSADHSGGSGEGVVDIYSLSSTVPESLFNLQEKLASLRDPAALDQALTAIAMELKEMESDVSFVENSDRVRPGRTQAYEEQAQRLAFRLKRIIEPVRQAVTDLSSQREIWLGRRASLDDIQVDTPERLAIVKDEKKKLGAKIDQAIAMIDHALTPYLELGRRAGDILAQLQAIQNDLRKINEKMRTENISRRGPSVFSAEFYTRFDGELLRETKHSLTSFAIEEKILAREQGKRLILAIFFIPLIAAIRWLKQFQSATRWAAFANQPLSTTVFLISTAMLVFNKLSADLALPQEWELFLHIANILAVVRLLKGAGLHPNRRRLLSRLAIFLAVALCLTVINPPTSLVFLYVFLVSALAVGLYLHGLVIGAKKDGSGKVEEILRKFWGILPAIFLIAGLTGFDHFAVFFFFGVLSSIVSILMIWMLFRFHESLLELALSVAPMAAVREHQAIILGKIRPVLFWAHGLLMLAVVAVVWMLYPSVDAAIAGINGFGFTIGDIRLSPGLLVTVMLIFYIGLLVSEASRFMLVRGVLPRYTSEMGVRMSIARLSHYIIISLTLLIMLRVFGFQLAQLAIVGGALGVGIGFGLQAIVNNFASGLILLFERPIKVGDTICFGSDIGEVREVGLRATIIRTYDNAEIVVPNSMLITGQVTNWTLANRRARLKVPVSAAYGSDVAKVMEILLACAKEHPGILSEPKPSVFLLAFSDSALNFQLRVWLPDYLDSTNVLSELNVEIDSRFTEAGIEMPFPQSDLHLRSMDASVAGHLRGLPKENEGSQA